MRGALSILSMKRVGWAIVLGTMLSAIFVGAQEAGSLDFASRPGPFLLSAGLYAAYCGFNAFGWALILRSFGYPITAAAAVPLWIRCEALRWLPGSVWNFGARAVEVRKLGVPQSIAAASMTFELMFSVASKVLFAVWGGFLFANQLHATPRVDIVVGTVVGVALLMAIVLRNKLDLAGRQYAAIKSACATAFTRKRLRDNLSLFAYYLCTGLLQGIALKFLVVAITGNGNVSTMVLVSANAAAWLAGFFALFAPGGIVVREAALATALATWLPPAECVSIALCWRLLQTIIEVVLVTLTVWQAADTSVSSQIATGIRNAAKWLSPEPKAR